jgi:dUTP pyrophosphatase
MTTGRTADPSPDGRVRVRIARQPGGEGLPLPEPATAGAAGMDLRAAVDTACTIAPGARALVPTGFAIALPAGYEAQIRPRSGLALRHGVTIPNAPGTIDADYRGEVSVLLINLGDAPYRIERGARIAQMVVAPVSHATLVEVELVEATERGAGGYGSTGTG